MYILKSTGILELALIIDEFENYHFYNDVFIVTSLLDINEDVCVLNMS